MYKGVRGVMTGGPTVCLDVAVGGDRTVRWTYIELTLQGGVPEVWMDVNNASQCGELFVGHNFTTFRLKVGVFERVKLHQIRVF